MSQKLQSIVNTSTGRTKSNPLPPGFSEQEQANQFAKFFTEKIENIRNELDGHDLYTPRTRQTNKPETFRTLSMQEVKKIISKMQSKSREDDILPTKFIKEILDYFLPTITDLVNLSLQEGSFISDWKCVIVRPLIKKLELGCARRNYRPVSNLQFISKIVECAMLQEINNHCDINLLQPHHQSAYQKFHGCETAAY